MGDKAVLSFAGTATKFCALFFSRLCQLAREGAGHALLRSMKLQDRQYRDVVEALKADMTELHGKVDGSVATMKQYRIELARAEGPFFLFSMPVSSSTIL